MDDLLADFITETHDGLGEIDQQLLGLEQDPSNLDIIRDIFRVLHTIKGTCGFLGLERLQKLAHAAENVFGKMREEQLQLNEDILSVLFDAVDRLKEITDALENGEPEGDSGPDGEIISRLDACLEIINMGEANVKNTEAEIPAEQNPEPTFFAEEEPKPQDESPQNETIAPEADQGGDAPLFTWDDDFSENTNEATTKNDETNADQQADTEKTLPEDAATSAQDLASIETEAAETSSETPENQIGESVVVEKPKQEVKKPSLRKTEPDPAPKSLAVNSQQSIRVGLDVLDNLINLVSELVLTRNQLQQLGKKNSDNFMKSALSRLSFVTTDLQEEVMKTRMQPIESAWSKVPRQVRDLAKSLGKKISVNMIGQETELDRQVLELIKDPLTHMIRNGCDHGIEMPEDRVAVGKPEEGTITLKAYHESGNVMIVISDDGKGLDPQKLKSKIIEKGLSTPEELDLMEDTQIMSFIFHAGFSTAQAVTNVSGRGVGMDVVRTNIEKLGGTVDLSSVPGKGSQFIIKIPLTLTIVSSLILECGQQKFAIPQAMVSELVHVSSRSNIKIEYINKSPVLRLRNQTLALIDLSEQLELDAQRNRDLYIICININGHDFGLIVDKVYDTQEIVVKPLSPLLKDIYFFSGCTILGDGSVILILDGNAIVNKIITVPKNEISVVPLLKQRSPIEKVLLLIFSVNKQVKAVPLVLVGRITEINRSIIELSGGQYVVPYKGAVLPILSTEEHPIPSVLQRFSDAEQENIPLLIFSDMGRSVGVVIDEIIDITEEKLHIDVESSIPGNLGSCMINNELTSILDTEHYLKTAYPDWFNRSANIKAVSQKEPHVLVIDDNHFFRNLIHPLVKVAGFKVSTASDGDEALEICMNQKDFDIIVSDIEMPNMNGFEFVKNLRLHDDWKDTPVIALSSLSSEEDIQKGYDSGFNAFVQKSDHKTLIDILNKYREKIVPSPLEELS